jgi:hypothetical protein
MSERRPFSIDDTHILQMVALLFRHGTAETLPADSNTWLPYVDADRLAELEHTVKLWRCVEYKFKDKVVVPIAVEGRRVLYPARVLSRQTWPAAGFLSPTDVSNDRMFQSPKLFKDVECCLTETVSVIVQLLTDPAQHDYWHPDLQPETETALAADTVRLLKSHQVLRADTAPLSNR